MSEFLRFEGKPERVPEIRVEWEPEMDCLAIISYSRLGNYTDPEYAIISKGETVFISGAGNEFYPESKSDAKRKLRDKRYKLDSYFEITKSNGELVGRTKDEEIHIKPSIGIKSGSIVSEKHSFSIGWGLDKTEGLKNLKSLLQTNT